MFGFIIVTILVIVALAIVPGTIRNLVRYF